MCLQVADVRNRQLEIEAAIAADALEQEERKISVRNVERDAEAQVSSHQHARHGNGIFSTRGDI